MGVRELRRKPSDCYFLTVGKGVGSPSETRRKPVGKVGLKERSKEKRARAPAYACARALQEPCQYGDRP